MAAPLKEIASAGAKAASGFREAMQDLLVPELRALKVSMDAIRTEMQLRDERHSEILESQGERLAQAIESLTQEMRLRDQHHTQQIEALEHRTTEALFNLSQKLDYAMDIRERLALVEARVPKQ